MSWVANPSPAPALTALNHCKIKLKKRIACVNALILTALVYILNIFIYDENIYIYIYIYIYKIYVVCVCIYIYIINIHNTRIYYVNKFWMQFIYIFYVINHD